MNARRIASIVRVRELQERLARAEVGRRRAELSTAEGDERAAREELRTATAPPMLSVGSFVAHRRALGAGVADADALAGRVVQRRAQVDDAMGSWRFEAQRLDGIERLATRVAELERADVDRREAVELDDLVVGRWNREER